MTPSGELGAPAFHLGISALSIVNLQACVMTGKTKVNELSLCSSGRPGSSWPSEFCVVWTFSLRRDAHTGGMSIPFCGSLGTVFHLPSRNCSNEARHIAFHPALPAIRHSSYFSLWPQRSVCIHRHNVVGQACPLPSGKKKKQQHLCARYTSYTWNTVLFRSYCCDFPAAVTVDVAFVCVPPTAQNESRASEYRGRSYGHDLQI